MPLSDQMCALLWRYVSTPRKRRARLRQGEALFLSSWGTPIDARRLSTRSRAHVRRANIPYRVRFHDLRHAAATWSMEAEMPKERVSRMLGHANDRITTSYEHVDFEDVQRAYEGRNPLRLLA